MNYSTSYFLFFLGSFLILPLLSSYFKVKDGLIGFVAILANIGGCVGIAFAWSPLSMYLGITVIKIAF